MGTRDELLPVQIASWQHGAVTGPNLETSGTAAQGCAGALTSPIAPFSSENGPGPATCLDSTVRRGRLRSTI